ncbi:hypothetical protein [Nonomuraea dietziae]|uniref:hypothetical protein n=1 Tax=Nonomuraea dietziae TaxID=65515 RepID=UPI0031D150E1
MQMIWWGAGDRRPHALVGERDDGPGGRRLAQRLEAAPLEEGGVEVGGQVRHVDVAVARSDGGLLGSCGADAHEVHR